MRKLPISFDCERGAVPIIPLLVIVAIGGIVGFLLVSSTAPFLGNLFNILFPKPSSEAAVTGFLETFAYGVPTAPQPFKSSKWIIGYGGNQNGDTTIRHPDGTETVTRPLIEAGHGPGCQGPMGNSNPALNIHLLQNTSTVDLYSYYRDHAQQQFFLCNNHMMTINKSGGDALFFMPRYLLDWSGGRTANLQFDTNPDGWARNWWEVYIAPQDELIMSANFSKRAVVFANISHHFQIKRIANYNIARRDDPITGYCSVTPRDPACDDPRIRRTHKISFNTTNWSMSVVKPDGSLFTQSGPWRNADGTPASLDFTSGMVLMTHYSYNPIKDEVPANPSMLTFHWANFMFDGPANRLMTGYAAEPQYITTVPYSLNGRPAGRNPSDLVHINVTSSDLRNPRIWGVLGGRDSCGNSGCPDKTHTDPKNTTRWGEVSLNGGPWLTLPSIRELGAVDQPYPHDTGMSFQTNVPANYPNPVRLGDNTLQFRHTNYVGFQIQHVEIQVDPNADLPLANTGGCAGSETGGGTCTPAPSVSSGPLPTPPPPTITPTMTPSPTIAPTPVPTATVAPGTGSILNLWSSSVVPQTVNHTDTSSVEVGVRFRSDVTGVVNGIRFYKGPLNTGAHSGHLWSSTGTLLGSVNFTTETASGWQQANFASPIAINASTTYVASYHTSGRFALNQNYFGNGVDNGVLHAPANSVSVGNGVYAYGTNILFPSSTYNASNYWVDVSFTRTTTGATPAPTQVPTPVPTIAPTIAPTSAPGVPQTITFDEFTSGLNRALTGQYPTNIINWGTTSGCSVAGVARACWFLSAPWRVITTNSFSFNGTGLNTAPFNFVTPKRVISLFAYNGGSVSSTVALSCAGNTTRTVTLAAGASQTITTGWTNTCNTVTLSSTNGWNTNFDTMVIQ